MFTRRTARTVFSLAVAISGLTLLAAPASAETILKACNGTCGYYEYRDSEPPPSFGANCAYEKGSYDLDFMSGKPPVVHGPFASKSPVAWRINILRSSNFGTSWSKIYTSSWDSAMASSTVAAYAGHGFARIRWNAPENPTGWFKMRVDIRWKSNGGNVIGTASAEYNSYKGLWNGSSDSRQDHCIQDW